MRNETATKFHVRFVTGRLLNFETGVTRVEAGRGTSKSRTGENFDDDFVKPKQRKQQNVQAKEPISEIPERAVENWQKKKGKQVPKKIESTLGHSYLVPYGGQITYQGSLYGISNKCNIDGVLTVLALLYREHSRINCYLNLLNESEVQTAQILIQSFGLISAGQIVKAKSLVITDIFKIRPTAPNLDLFESECRFLECLRDIVVLKRTYNCSNSDCPIAKKVSFSPFSDYAFDGNAEISSWFIRERILSECDAGCADSRPVVQLDRGIPPFFAFSIPYDPDRVVSDKSIPEKLVLINKKYVLTAYTYYCRGHFYAVIGSGKRKALYDGLRAESLHDFTEAPAGHHVSTVWYSKPGLNFNN